MDSIHRRSSNPNEYEHESPLSSSKRADRVDLGGVGIGWNMEKKHQLVQGEQCDLEIQNIKKQLTKWCKTINKAILPYAIHCSETVKVPNSDYAVLH